MGTDGTITSGLLRGIEDGWFMTEIADSAFRYQQQLEKGEKRVVGVNAYTAEYEDPLEILRVSHEVEREQKRVLIARPGRRRRGRPARDGRVSRTDGNMVPAMLDAVRAEATLGRDLRRTRAEWPAYTEPARFWWAARPGTTLTAVSAACVQ